MPDHLEAAFDEEGEPRTQEAQKHAALSDSLFIVGFPTDQSNGPGEAMYLGGGSVEPGQVSVTAVDVAEKLRVMSPSAPSRKSVEAELSDVIGDAKYWQPPDGVEFIAADDEVRTALIPWTEAVQATGVLGEWARPLENQWALDWDDSEVHGALAPVFDKKLGEVDGGRTVGFDALVADND